MTCRAELLSVLMLIVSCSAVLLMARFFGKSGLFAYSAISVVGANIQVLKLTAYSTIGETVALGTVLFSTTFLVDNILAEYYGAKTAERCVLASFSCYLFFTLIMRITIWHPEVANSGGCVNLHSELKNVFSPSWIFFVSSLISYVVGQFVDIFAFLCLKKLMKNKRILLRAFFAMALSTFADNCVFSILAWIVFAEKPIDLQTLWKTYIFIAYPIRLVIAVLCAPLVKLAGLIIPREPNVQEFRL
ncbi:MAG: queuosine precursor transporter [Holosporaceae bacterium]|jgi:uncharacterized integral membrane protein (TIGR00697 family)|nr:queuosine precursor transporter [Holosporaceae bacterium]